MKHFAQLPLLILVLASLTLIGCATYQTAGPSIKPDLIVAADGTAEYETISDAIDDASDGDVILVRPGIYEEEVELDESTDNLTLVGQDPAKTIIDADGEYAAVTLAGGNHRVSGFTIRGGDSHGIYVRDGQHQIDHCLIIANSDRGIYASTMAGNPAVNVDHCTIVENKVSGLYIVRDNPKTSITNSIIAFNGRGIVCDRNEGKMTVNNNCLFNNGENLDRVPKGKGNIEQDPQFVNRSAGNYRLKKSSPCIGKASDGSNIGCF